MGLELWPLLTALAALVFTLTHVRRKLREPVERMAAWLHRVHAGGVGEAPELPSRGLLAPLARGAAALALDLRRAQDSARQEALLRHRADSLWTKERLRECVRDKLDGRPLVVVANREPYRHLRRGGAVVCEAPASGLVTGLEPVLLACGGTWVADGDGSADRETADGRGRLRVPPEAPQYCLRRVWLTQEEEQGYYLGFSNEGLWPLCHIAHMRPIFRPSDWEHYRKVNEKFAQAVCEEIETLREPCLLIQDYHFTLLPRMLKARRPDARVALFWHIPWPNAEAFGICPWQSDLLKGMLGADLIGFHTQSHCNNFLDTVDRVLESRIDRERFEVRRGERASLVRPFPISVDFQDVEPLRSREQRQADRKRLCKTLGCDPAFLAVGVDRVDYTKGILERFRGLERFLDKYPRYRGKLVLAQIGAPSRLHIPAYARLNAEVEAEAERINARFMASGAPPIVLLRRQHSREEILPFYRNADLCLVTPLHDGMNLVAKEFVAAQDGGSGALVLSRFAGASRELRDALLVNPYDVEELAEAIRAGLEMDAPDRAARMARLRGTVRENNVYRWAGELITELASVRLGIEART